MILHPKLITEFKHKNLLLKRKTCEIKYKDQRSINSLGATKRTKDKSTQKSNSSVMFA